MTPYLLFCFFLAVAAGIAVLGLEALVFLLLFLFLRGLILGAGKRAP